MNYYWPTALTVCELCVYVCVNDPYLAYSLEGNNYITLFSKYIISKGLYGSVYRVP